MFRQTLIISRTNQTEDYYYNLITAIIANGSNYTTKCDKCVASTNVMHEAAVSQPVSVITDLLIRLCVNPLSRSMLVAEIANPDKATLLTSASMRRPVKLSSRVLVEQAHIGHSCKDFSSGPT